jgi:hypothetical protein
LAGVTTPKNINYPFFNFFALLKNLVAVIPSEGCKAAEVEESVKNQISPLRSLRSLRSK